MTLAASAPTRAPSPPLPPALPAGSASAAAPAAPWHGKTSVVPFVVGAALALALADTRAAPVVIAILTGAVIFQLMHL